MNVWYVIAGMCLVGLGLVDLEKKSKTVAEKSKKPDSEKTENEPDIPENSDLDIHGGSGNSDSEDDSAEIGSTTSELQAS